MAQPFGFDGRYVSLQFKDTKNGVDRTIVLPTELAYRLVSRHVEAQQRSNAQMRPLTPENEESGMGNLRKVHPESIISDAENLHSLWRMGIIFAGVPVAEAR